ncbi:hypothetical protein [Pseudanabaena phage PA-SR01]|nr:hypothetical protein [Pseudanabaena phage PA-SR01]
MYFEYYLDILIKERKLNLIKHNIPSSTLGLPI